jgi:hypothetical protein
MKYIDAEKLIAGIDRLKTIFEEMSAIDGPRKEFFCGKKEMAVQTIGIITSLQQEQPEVNLEKEIEKMIYSCFFDLEGIAIVGTSEYATVDDMAYIARHFYELGLNARKEEYK